MINVDVTPGCGHDVTDLLLDRRINVDLAYCGSCCEEIFGGNDTIDVCWTQFRIRIEAIEQLDLVCSIRYIDDVFELEPLALGDRQFEGPFHLDGVLRREHHERLRQGGVSPSIVTIYSYIASISALWVFGEARLISSAITTFVKIGPRWRVNSPSARDRPTCR